MKSYIPLFAVATVALLSACNKNDQPEVVGGPADPMAAQLANAAPVELPPSVKSNKQYRCKDNSLLFVDFMSDDKTALLRTERVAPRLRSRPPKPASLSPPTARRSRVRATP